MHLTDLDIGLRRRLFEISDQDVAALASVRNAVAMNVDAVVEEFYQRQTAVPEIANVIGDNDTLGRLKGSMRRYVVELFSGRIDSDYVALRLRIGKVHHRLGVTPKLFLAALWMLSEVIGETLDRIVLPMPAVQRDAAKAAMRKILLFDAGLVLDTYIHGMAAEARIAKEQAERYAVSLEEIVVQKTRQIQEQSETDPITGLVNRAGFDKQLMTLSALAGRTRTPLTLAYIDIDKFKALNDRYGHAAGDDALRLLAQVLVATKRQSDIACRLGGDEFAVLLPGATAATAGDVMKRLLESLATYAERLSVSIGVAEMEATDASDPEALLRKADAAMYQAKRSGGHDDANGIAFAGDPESLSGGRANTPSAPVIAA